MPCYRLASELASREEARAKEATSALEEVQGRGIGEEGRGAPGRAAVRMHV